VTITDIKIVKQNESLRKDADRRWRWINDRNSVLACMSKMDQTERAGLRKGFWFTFGRCSVRISAGHWLKYFLVYLKSLQANSRRAPEMTPAHHPSTSSPVLYLRSFHPLNYELLTAILLIKQQLGGCITQFNIMMSYGLNSRGSILGKDTRFFYIQEHLDWIWSPRPPDLKGSGREADHPPTPSSTEDNIIFISGVGLLVLRPLLAYCTSPRW
jgi:hypothetical protein